LNYSLPNFFLYLIAISCDNAKTNDVLLRTLSRLLIDKYGIQFVPDNAHIRCLAHVVNLVVQKMLALLGEADHPEINDYYELMKDLPVHYDAENDEALKEMESEENNISEGNDNSDDEDLDDELLQEDDLDEPNAPKRKSPSALQKVRLLLRMAAYL
jgi:hypothetical protein